MRVGLTGCCWGSGVGGRNVVSGFGRCGGGLCLVGVVSLLAVEEALQTPFHLGQGIGSCADDGTLAVRKSKCESTRYRDLMWNCRVAEVCFGPTCGVRNALLTDSRHVWYQLDEFAGCRCCCRRGIPNAAVRR